MAVPISPERKALQTKANIYVVLGIVLSLATRLAIVAIRHAPRAGSPILFLFLIALLIAGFFCWYVGLSSYAQSKGYSKWLGLLGFLSCCGLVVLVVLPNRWVEASSDGYGPGDYPRPNG